MGKIENMNLLPFLLPVVMLVVFIAVRRIGLVKAVEARGLLRNGAQVIDVRNRSEFRARHLPQAVSMPVDTIEAVATERLGDRNQALLLHCQSGVRSGMARKKLRALGYTRVYNLGSYDRASRIVGGA